MISWSFQAIAQSVPDSSRTVEINNIHILGNKKTKRQIITREISVMPGDTIGLRQLVDTLKYSRNNVYNTNLFDEVEITIEELEPGVADLQVKVNERWYFYPMPIFRLADRNFNDWWVNQDRNFQRVTYGARVTQFNFRGRAERLRLVAMTGFEDRIIFNYKIPYLDEKQRIGLLPELILINSKNLGYETNDHLRNFLSEEFFLRRSLGATIWTTYREKFYEFHSAGIGFARTIIDDTVAMLNPNFLGGGDTRQRAFTLGYAYQFNRRNNVNYPLRGYNLYGEFIKTGLGVYDDVDYWSVLGSVSKYWDLGKEYYFANRTVGFYSNGDQPFFNYNGLGFEPQYLVRGYELDLIEGQAYLLSKNSARKLLFKRKADLSKFVPVKQFQTLPIAIYGKLFLDAAYVWNYAGYENNDRLTDKIIYGLGTGLDIVTMYDVVFRLEYSLNTDGETQFFINFMRDI